MDQIFIVDDEPALQFFYKKFLTLNGFEIIGIAEDGEEAVRMFKSFEKKPKVILMDHRMPEKTGLEATIEIFRIDRRVKIIFVSGDRSIREEALSLGAFSFWDKPFSIDQLLDTVREAIISY